MIVTLLEKVETTGGGKEVVVVTLIENVESAGVGKKAV